MATYPPYPELQSDAAVFAELLASKYWAVLTRYYDGMLEAKRNDVIGAVRDTFEYAKGVYLGSRDVVELPQAVIDEYKRQRSAREEAGRARSYGQSAGFRKGSTSAG